MYEQAYPNSRVLVALLGEDDKPIWAMQLGSTEVRIDSLDEYEDVRVWEDDSVLRRSLSSSRVEITVKGTPLG